MKSLHWLLPLFALLAACATDDPGDGKQPSDDLGADSAVADAGGDAGSDAGNNGATDLGQPDQGMADQGTPDAGECVDGATRDVACGLNDRGLATETCAAGAWGDPGMCVDPDVCVDGSTQPAACGRNGRGSVDQTCTVGAWLDDGMCSDPDECVDGADRTVACGPNGRGTQQQTCVSGTWDTSAMCADPGVCVDGSMRAISCGLNDRGSLDQLCVAGDWQGAGACADPDVCTDASTQTYPCGLNNRGAQQQTCTAGAWVDTGGCINADVCTDADTQTGTCGLNGSGTVPQLCVTGMWQDDGACTDPDVCTNGAMQQVACGFDGMQAQTCTAGMWADVGGCVEDAVGYCKTQPATLQTFAGEQTSTIEGTVWVDMKTPGAGAAAGVVGEVLWGPAGSDASTWTDTAAATYFGDADGLTAGDLANDVWHATITPANAGAYEYVFRFSADNGTTWQLCDLNGTVDGAFDGNSVGALDVLAPNFADDCKVQFPQLIEAAEVGQTIDFYGRVTEPGIAGTGSASADIVAELLVGSPGSDPRPDGTGFTTIAATYNASALNLGANEDEYQASFTPTVAGAYAFAFRFSVDGGAHWEFCGLRDVAVGSGFTPAKMGWLNAFDTPDAVDFCHVWQDTMSDDAATNTQPTVTVEVFEAGVTDSAAPSSDIVAEAAAIPLEENPALTSATWNALPYKGPRAGFPNNYEYEGTPYTAATHPAAGTYNVVVRVRRASTSDWTYCDIDDTADPFRLEAASRLTIN